MKIALILLAVYAIYKVVKSTAVSQAAPAASVFDKALAVLKEIF